MSLLKVSVALLLPMKLEIYLITGSYGEMLRIVTCVILWFLPKHVIPLSKLVCRNLRKKRWLPETLVNLETLLKLFMIAALAGAIASLLQLNTQPYLLLALAVDTCSQALLMLSYWVF